MKTEHTTSAKKEQQQMLGLKRECDICRSGCESISFFLIHIRSLRSCIPNVCWHNLQIEGRRNNTLMKDEEKTPIYTRTEEEREREGWNSFSVFRQKKSNKPQLYK